MIEFKNLGFRLDGEQLKMIRFGNVSDICSGICEVQVAGENKDTHLGAKMIRSSEGKRLKYVSHTVSGNVLTVVEQSDLIRAETVFTAYDDTNALRIGTTVTNISSAQITLEEVSSFCITGFGDKNKPDDMIFTAFRQSHHCECQPDARTFTQLGLYGGKSESQQRASFCNIGSWSTKEALPMGILENRSDSTFMMFQIESNNSWYYEISDAADKYYLYMSGPNAPFGGWFRTLAPGQSFSAPLCAVSFGKDLNDVIGNMTLYRRHIAGQCSADQSLPAIFNEYMHLSWDSPTADNTKKYAPIVAKTGVEYYVIDCGWHNEEDGDKIYPYVGHWLESNARFPEGVRETTDYIRSLGMKPGLWIEPEIIGIQCEKMLEHYDDDCFFQRHGKRLSVMNRHFLDFRNEKVRGYMTDTVERMIRQYGAQYIKFDYNQDCGVGTQLNAENPADGLMAASDAFLQWLSEITERFPNVIFEGCASGGMRMDYRTLSHFSLVSTSDQTDYLCYPYIAGNILSAVLPEQAAVWSYPVASDCTPDQPISDERIALNMINSFLGRMHLASHLDFLDDRQLELIRQGVAYYNSLSQIKKTALPYFPFGFAKFGDPFVCAGLKKDNRIYLAVWNLKNIHFLHIPFEQPLRDAKIAYPSFSSAFLCRNDRGLDIVFPNNQCAVFIEIELE